MFLLQELLVVDEEAVELGEVLLLCHLIFIIVSGGRLNKVTQSARNDS